LSLIYVYCLLQGGMQLDTADIEAIEPGSTVSLVAVGKLQAAISEVGSEFEEDSLNEHIKDLDWLSPRAVRHHDVIDQLYGRSKPLVPLSFGAIFHSAATLRQRLSASEDKLLVSLENLRGREEWDLKVSRDQATFSAQMRQRSAPLRQLDAELATKPPGTRFLMEKKLRTLETRESQRLASRVRMDAHEKLSACAVAAHRDELTSPPRSQTTRLELKSAYLVDESQSGRLRDAVEALAAEYSNLGYHFELTGPWPAFTFAGEAREALS
jgi:hypothetical protein